MRIRRKERRLQATHEECLHRNQCIGRCRGGEDKGVSDATLKNKCGDYSRLQLSVRCLSRTSQETMVVKAKEYSPVRFRMATVNHRLKDGPAGLSDCNPRKSWPGPDCRASIFATMSQTPAPIQDAPAPISGAHDPNDDFFILRSGDGRPFSNSSPFFPLNLLESAGSAPRFIETESPS